MRSFLILLALAIAVPPPVSARQLPLGDGHVSDRPVVGNVYPCRATFRAGARHDGPWFHGDTWNPAEKPHVQGRVMWPEVVFALTPRGDGVAVAGNGLPVEQPTGLFPIARDDAAYPYDRNPNAIAAHELSFEIPASPERADRPGCLPMGMIGFTITGVALFNALDDAGRDAAAHETGPVPRATLRAARRATGTQPR